MIVVRPSRSAEGASRRISWADKRHALQRELDYRRRFYPGWIAKGRFDQAQGDRQIAALAAMLSMYDEGLAWAPSPPDVTPEERRRQWAETAAALHSDPLTLSPSKGPQEELALRT